MPVIGNFQLANGQAAYGGGTATAGPAAVNVGLGFVPRYVKVFNLVANAVVTTEFIQGDDDVDMGEGVKIDAAAAAGATAAELAANGITVGTVTIGDQQVEGFTIGTGCLTANTSYMWIALG
jgi:hypothetical protein